MRLPTLPTRLAAAALVAVALHVVALLGGAALLEASMARRDTLQRTEPLLTVEADDAEQGASIQAAVTIDAHPHDATVTFTLSRDRRLDAAGATPSGETQSDDTLLAVARWPASEQSGQPHHTVLFALDPPADAQGPYFLAATWTPDDALGTDVTAWDEVWIDPQHPGQLELTSVIVPETAGEGDRVPLRTALRNAGPGWVRLTPDHPARLAFLLSRDSTTDPSDTALHTALLTRPVPPHTDTDVTADAWLPVGVTGRQRVITTLAHDAMSQRTTAINITPAVAPDLAVTHAAAPPRIAVGTEVLARYAVTNTTRVNADADTGWADAVLVSDDPTLDPDDTPLLERRRTAHLSGGETYQADVGVTLPASLWDTLPSDQPETTRYLLFVADTADVVGEAGREGNNLRAVRFEMLREAVEPPRAVLGRDDAPPRLTVAWISHDAFERMQANQGRTDQPAVQDRAAPTPDAPLRADATPPRSAGQSETTPAFAAPTNTPRATPTRPAQAASPQYTQPWSARWPGFAAPNPSARDGATASISPPNARTTPAEPNTPTNTTATNEAEATTSDATPPSADARTDDTTDPTPPTPRDAPNPRPTATPRDTAQADAAALVRVPVLRPGRVDVAEGLQVSTARPDIAVATLLTTIPRDVTAQLTFDTDGKVIDVRLGGSAGSAGLDGPLRAALYRWRASGKQLAEWDGPRVFSFRILWPR